jgi:hypothetical protein
LYALIRPLPKLPTSRSPANVPNESGASASPHGAFSGAFFLPCFATRASSVPSVPKRST